MDIFVVSVGLQSKVFASQDYYKEFRLFFLSAKLHVQ